MNADRSREGMLIRPGPTIHTSKGVFLKSKIIPRAARMVLNWEEPIPAVTLCVLLAFQLFAAGNALAQGDEDSESLSLPKMEPSLLNPRLPCPAGQYYVHSGCVMASPGFHVSDAMATNQIPCDGGTYQPTAGQTRCVPVDTNYYVPSDGRGHVAQLACPADQHPNATFNGCISGAPDPFIFEPTSPVGAVEVGPTLTPPLALPADNVGASVAVSDNVMAVGACVPRTTTRAGYVTVYTRTSYDAAWMPVANLTASDGVLGDQFGASVALSGDDIVVGAYWQLERQQGAVYHYRRPSTGWVDMTETQKLVGPDDGLMYHFFGFSVAIAEDVLIVGRDGANHTAGDVRLFTRPRYDEPWLPFSTGIRPDWVAGDVQFGHSVAIDPCGTSVVIGAPYDSSTAFYAGAASVWTLTDGVWAEQQKIVPNSETENANFGRAVAISGDTIAIGAENDNDINICSGAVYIYVRSGTEWTMQAKLHAFDGVAWHFFGNKLALHRDTLIVGTYRDATQGKVGAGAAYVFHRRGDTWAHVAKVYGTPTTKGRMGMSVAVSGSTIAIGAPGVNNTGTVYMQSMISPAANGIWAGYAIDTTGVARPCDNGGFANRPWQPRCHPADPGFFVPADGQPHMQQTPCNDGDWQGGVGAAACAPADIGYIATADHTDQIPCDNGTYQNTTGQTQCLPCALQGPTFSTPEDGAPHSTCIDWMPPSPTVDSGELVVLRQSDMALQIAGVKIGGRAALTVTTRYGDVIVVPVVDGLTVPASTQSMDVALSDGSTASTSVHIAPTTIPTPHTVIGGTAARATTASPLCPAIMDLGMLGSRAIESATFTGGAIRCVSAPIPVTAATVRAMFPPILVDPTPGRSVCVSLTGAEFGSTEGLTVVLNGRTLPPYMTAGIVCVVLITTDGSMDMPDTAELVMYLDGEMLFEAVLSFTTPPLDAGFPWRSVFCACLIIIALMALATCAGVALPLTGAGVGVSTLALTAIQDRDAYRDLKMPIKDIFEEFPAPLEAQGEGTSDTDLNKDVEWTPSLLSGYSRSDDSSVRTMDMV